MVALSHRSKRLRGAHSQPAPTPQARPIVPLPAQLPAPLPHPPIVPRNYHFELPASRILDWHGCGLHATAFNNTLSLFFPLGETFFIHAVKRYQHLVPPGSALEGEVFAFVEQEAIHSREHEAYNAALRPHYCVWLIEGVLWCVLWPFERCAPLALAGTVALEHLTGSLGHLLVSDEALMQGSEPRFAELWYWHAVEETEHKAVAFDVYTLAFGSGLGAWALRVFAMAMALLIFLALFIPTFLYLVIRAGGLCDCRGWRGLARHHWGGGASKGMMRRMGPMIKVRGGGGGALAKPLAACVSCSHTHSLPTHLAPFLQEYFRRDFHPWQHNNVQFLKPLLPPSSQRQ